MLPMKTRAAPGNLKATCAGSVPRFCTKIFMAVRAALSEGTAATRRGLGVDMDISVLGLSTSKTRDSVSPPGAASKDPAVRTPRRYQSGLAAGAARKKVAVLLSKNRPE